MGQIRITGGTHRSRKITVEDQPGLRPTSDRIRETLFNWLGQNLAGQRVVDMYAGSGILALEAASRGAAEVICVENNRITAMQLKMNIQAMQMPQVSVHIQSAKQFTEGSDESYDLMFLDPPFDSDEMHTISGIISPLILPGGLVYREYGPNLKIKPLNTDMWAQLKHKKAGQVHFELWQKK